MGPCGLLTMLLRAPPSGTHVRAGHGPGARPLRELLARHGIGPGQEEPARAIPVRAGLRRLDAGSRRGPRVVNRTINDMITGGARTGRLAPGERCKRCCKVGVSTNRAGTVSYTAQDVTAHLPVPPQPAGPGTGRADRCSGRLRANTQDLSGVAR